MSCKKIRLKEHINTDMNIKKWMILILVCVICTGSIQSIFATENNSESEEPADTSSEEETHAALDTPSSTDVPSNAETDVGTTNIASMPNMANVPQTMAETAVVIDIKTGTVIYDKDKDKSMYPASVTKVMTALLTLENLPLDHVVTIDAETPFTEGSRIYLEEGEEITVEELLYALMLDSANDAANALAKAVSGSVEAFALLMNERAKELGALNSNFVNPSGLHDDAHATTAYDMALISRHAMENEMFRTLVTTYQYTIPESEHQDTRYLYNSNRLIYDKNTVIPVNGEYRTAYYDGATGIKTGTTDAAGPCLAASAQRDGSEFIVVLMRSEGDYRFGDAVALLDWAFANYHTVQVSEDGAEIGQINVSGGEEDSVSLMVTEKSLATLPADAGIDEVTRIVKVSEEIEAPVAEGLVVGQIEFYYGELSEPVSTIPVMTAESMEEGGILAVFGVSNDTTEQIGKILIGVIIVIALLFIALLYIRHQNIKKRKKRRAERALQIAMEREVDKFNKNRERYYNEKYRQ